MTDLRTAGRATSLGWGLGACVAASTGGLAAPIGLCCGLVVHHLRPGRRAERAFVLASALAATVALGAAGAVAFALSAALLLTPRRRPARTLNARRAALLTLDAREADALAGASDEELLAAARERLDDALRIEPISPRRARREARRHARRAPAGAGAPPRE
jgi:hypothetical protein